MADYRYFTEDKSSYVFDGKTFKLNYDATPNQIKEIVRKANEWGKTPFQPIEDLISHSLEILELGLVDFKKEDYESHDHSELQGWAGDILGFLYAKRSKREEELLMKRLEEIQKH